MTQKTPPPTGAERLLALLEGAAVAVAGLSLLAMGGIVTASVIGRQAFLSPIPDDLVMIGLLMVCVIALPLAFIERHRGHIAVTVTTDWLGVRAQGALRALGALAMGVFFGGIGVMVSLKLPREISENTYYDGVLEIPTWPMKIVFALGIALFLIRLAVSFAGGIRTAITGEAPPPVADRHGA